MHQYINDIDGNNNSTDNKNNGNDDDNTSLLIQLITDYLALYDHMEVASMIGTKRQCHNHDTTSE